MNIIETIDAEIKALHDRKAAGRIRGQIMSIFENISSGGERHQIADASKMMKLSEREKHVLLAMAKIGYEWASPFKSIAKKCRKVESHNIRRVTRSLARKGLAKYCRGLLTDEGEVAGSGYAITKAGIEVARTLAVKP